MGMGRNYSVPRAQLNSGIRQAGHSRPHSDSRRALAGRVACDAHGPVVRPKGGHALRTKTKEAPPLGRRRLERPSQYPALRIHHDLRGDVLPVLVQEALVFLGGRLPTVGIAARSELELRDSAHLHGLTVVLME